MDHCGLSPGSVTVILQDEGISRSDSCHQHTRSDRSAPSSAQPGLNAVVRCFVRVSSRSSQQRRPGVLFLSSGVYQR